MARFRRKKRQKAGDKLISESPHASLAAMAPIIEAKGIFCEIHNQVLIEQKTLDYRASDKLVMVILSMLSGNQTISEVNWSLRVDKGLLMAFGYPACADQSVLQDTLNAATAENVDQLRRVAASLFGQHNLLSREFHLPNSTEMVTIDFDLSAQPCSKGAEKASKGYFAKRRNSYGRQLARVSVAQTSEIVADQLYAGNTLSCAAFKDMVYEMEQVLNLGDKAPRRQIRLRLDGGFGTDDNINFALARGYQLLVKMYSGNRARKLAESVENWGTAKTMSQQHNGEEATREVAWIKTPHRYCAKTRQIAIRAPNPKCKCGYSYRVIVTTDLLGSLGEILDDYDKRGGVPESLFCQDNQGLAQRKRTKQRFCAQQMLMLLTQIAHNLCLWVKQWTIDAIDFARRCDDWSQQISHNLTSETNDANTIFEQTQAMLKQRGIKRFTHQLFAIAGQITFNKGKLSRIRFNDGYPMMNRILVAFSAVLAPYCVQIAVGNT